MLKGIKSYQMLALKELWAQKVTSVLIWIAVVLSTIATTVMGQSVGILQAMRIHQAEGLNGNRYATFHQLTAEQNAVLLADARLKELGSWIYLGSTVLGNSGLRLQIREYQGTALDIYPEMKKLKEGRLPQTKGEIALSQEALQYLGFQGTVGDKISLPLEVSRQVDHRLPYQYTADFVLTGILENWYMGRISGIMEGIVGEGTAVHLLPERYLLYSTDFKTINKNTLQQVVTDLAKQLKIEDAYIQYNWVLLDALGIDYGEKDTASDAGGFPFMMAACVLTGILILLAAGLVIYNILKVAVAKRIRGYGTLRAIGCEKNQLYLLVTIQLLILCGAGLPFGVLLGGASTKWILTAALGGLGNPDIFMAENMQELNAMVVQNSTWKGIPLLISVGVTVLFAVLAAFPAARYASKVSPTVAMGGQALRIKRHSRKTKNIRSFEAFYARLNLKRNKGRTAITILSMVMSITVFVALQGFSGLLDSSSSVKNMHLGDYAVTNEKTGISPEAMQQLAENEMVADLRAAKLTIYESNQDGKVPIENNLALQPWETLQIASLNEAWLENYVSGLSTQDLEDLKKGKACIIKNPIPLSFEGQTVTITELQIGDRITINGVELRVVGITDEAIIINNSGFTNGVQVIAAESVYNEITGKTLYTEMYPILKPDADEQIFEEWLDQWCEGNAGTHWLSYRVTDKELAESFAQIRMLSWGLILFIGLIGVLNIINTVYTNIHTRVNEIGMQRAIGMSTGSLYRTFLWEGVYYGLIASGIGAVSGYICTIFIQAAATDSLQLAPVPIVPILEAACVSVIACIAATALPLRTIARMSVVEAVDAE